jgi:2'-5' RNA ligase
MTLLIPPENLTRSGTAKGQPLTKYFPMPTRTQLTLFLPTEIAVPIEALRRTHNPAQHALIAAHVTLCREDELAPIEAVLKNLANLEMAAITIDFGPVTRFSDGKGVMLPANGENESFQQLRAAILQGIIENPRRHEPHITLMHPRNSTCTDTIYEQIASHVFPAKIRFGKISLIEQEMGKEWQVLQEFRLNG